MRDFSARRVGRATPWQLAFACEGSFSINVKPRNVRAARRANATAIREVMLPKARRRRRRRLPRQAKRRPILPRLKRPPRFLPLL